MNTEYSFLQPGERVVVFQKGLTLGDFILSGFLSVLLAVIIIFGAIFMLVTDYLSPKYFSVIFLICLPVLWLYFVVSFIIRAVTAKGILTDRRIILTDRASPRAEIPLRDIESIRYLNKRQVEVARKSLYSKKYYILKDARAFVEAYNRLMDSDPTR